MLGVQENYKKSNNNDNCGRFDEQCSHAFDVGSKRSISLGGRRDAFDVGSTD